MNNNHLPASNFQNPEREPANQVSLALLQKLGQILHFDSESNFAG